MTEKEFSKLVQQLVKYEKRISSLTWNFWRGIVYGLGFFIGSALLAALFVYILNIVQGWAYIGGFIKNIVRIIENT